jgi:2-keto-4-pentenoate hydratase/2-oxohepta-3-ene-1,7-dioic acid hydratase in catechol pathway
MRFLRVGPPGAERPVVLDPGDVINTGTPAGVAFGADAFPHLVPGDVVETEIERLGRQRHVLGPA